MNRRSASDKKHKRTRTPRRTQARRLRLVAVLLTAILGLSIAVLAALPDAAAPRSRRVAEQPAPQATPGGRAAPAPTAAPAAERPDQTEPAREPDAPTEAAPVDPAPQTPEPEENDRIVLAPAAPPARPEPSPPAERGTIYLVIDDAGYNIHQLQPFLDFEGPLAVAVLPGLRYSRQAAEMALRAGKTVMLHQPMEAENGADPGPGAVSIGMSPEEIADVVGRNADGLPGVVGANNHMGSRVTRDPEAMRAVLSALHSRGLFFVDSRTTAATVADRVAAEVGIPFGRRHVFLDNEPKREAIDAAFRTALEVSRREGYAVVIGHVWTDALAPYLHEVYSGITKDGYRFAPITELVKG